MNKRQRKKRFKKKYGINPSQAKRCVERIPNILDVLRESMKNASSQEIEFLKEFAIQGAIELIQVAAMAQKFIDSMKDPIEKKLGEIIQREENRIGGK